jgi:hypothetical protein
MVTGSQAQEPADLEAFTMESRAKIKAFAGELQGELGAAIKSGGPISAIDVCHDRAPEIAEGLSTEGWHVARTSHRTRNPGNAPDAWEAAVLDSFIARAEAGETFDAMDEAEIVETDNGKAYRYMKAIPVGEVCLTCHGTDLDADLAAQIASLYPADQATGFELGQLRGAFTVTRQLDN